jgi:hypothetical protein
MNDALLVGGFHGHSESFYQLGSDHGGQGGAAQVTVQAAPFDEFQ